MIYIYNNFLICYSNVVFLLLFSLYYRSKPFHNKSKEEFLLKNLENVKNISSRYYDFLKGIRITISLKGCSIKGKMASIIKAR